MNTKTAEDNILEFWYVNAYIQNLESGDDVEVLDKNDFIESMKSYSDQNNTPLKKRIEELEATLVKCELTFGIIEEIHSILRRAQPIDLPDIIDEIEVDIPLIQAVIKDTLNQQHNGE